MNKFAQTVTDFRGTVEKVLHFRTQARWRRFLQIIRAPVSH